MAKKTGLGRGLGALLSNDVNNEIPIQPNNQALNNIPLHLIDPNRSQPRKHFDDERLHELAESIKSSGVLQPLIVRINKDRYTIVAGERRWRAALMAGLKEVPAIVREYSDAEIMQIALIENIQRADLNPVEEANGIKALLEEYNLTQDEVGKKIGKSRPTITNSLRLLKLPESVLSMLQEGIISSGHARCLVGLNDESLYEKVANIIVEKQLSVRQTESLCKLYLNKEPNDSPRKNARLQPELFEVQNLLQACLETKVKITGNTQRGRISIEYYSQEQLEKLYEYLKN